MTRSAYPRCHERTDRRVRNTRRAGYTLLEITVVAAIMAMIAALALPSISSMFGDSQFEAAGDMILARMADARSMAMEQGKPYRFGFMPGTGQFQIAADDSPVWQSSSSQGAAAIDKQDQLTGQLPEGVHFNTEPSTASGGAGAPGGWQVGAVFLPDGTARGGFNPDGTTIDNVAFYYGMAGRLPHGVRLRGLTGTIRLFDPADDEANQP